LEVGDRHKFKTLAEQEAEKKKAYQQDREALGPRKRSTRALASDTMNDPYEALPRVGYGPNARKRRPAGGTNSSISVGSGQRLAIGNRNGIRSPVIQRGREFDAYGLN
tara:strand:- start:1020 stop:1343 length:324 start_codon:yes stop_codon:yes gene_type:complete